MLSDLAGLGLGFWETKAWLAHLTTNIFTPAFYATDVIGSFNWWMRVATGCIFSFGVTWIVYHQAELYFSELAGRLTRKLGRVGHL